MQKFTRALTREIEVGGERLAVTLNAEGITLRPVGGRKPPHTLSWASLTCASTGTLPVGDAPTAEQLAAALEALHAGAKEHAAPQPLAAASSPTLKPLLGRLDAWLAKHRARYHEGLVAPASADDLDALAQVLGRPLPSDLTTWLRWHNGQSEDLIGTFYEAFHLLSAAQIAAAWQDRQSNPEPGWHGDWIPFLDDYQGDLIVLDPTPTGSAVREVWRGKDEHPVTAASLAAWLEPFVKDVENGRYHEDPERGEFRHT